MMHTKRTKTQAKNRRVYASRVKYKCPPRLQEFIELANLLPPDTWMPDFDSFGSVEQSSHLENQTAAMQESFEEYRRWLEGQPATFQGWIENDIKVRRHGPEQPAYALMIEWLYTRDSYEGYRSIRQDLRLLAGFCTDVNLRSEDYVITVSRWHMRKARDFVRPDSPDFERFSRSDFERVNDADLFINAQGKLDVMLRSKVALASIGAPARLRSCDYCDRVFWADRKDKQTCSINCAVYRRRRVQRESMAKKRTATKGGPAKKSKSV